jgi:uncharacterized protein (TIGR02996 family)
MHSEHAAFLRAIRAAPDDDLPRLIYADYLDDHGDPRGEFIRVQIERPRLRRDDPRRMELKAREDELLRRHREEWEGPLAAVVSHAVFRRGFIDDVLVMAEAFLAHARILFDWAPIQTIKLRGTFRYVAAILKRPELAALSGLDLCFDHLDGRDAALLAACRHLAGLKRLNLNGNPIGDEGVACLGTSPHLTGLEALHLEHCGLGPAAVDTLVASRLTRLRALDFSENLLGDSGVARLATASFLGRFVTLDLTAVGMNDEGARRLGESPALRGLRRLRLGYNGIGDAGAIALVRSPHLAGLTSLDLNGNAIGDAGAQAVLDAPHLRGLARLELSVNPLSRAMRLKLDEAFGERWG